MNTDEKESRAVPACTPLVPCRRWARCRILLAEKNGSSLIELAVITPLLLMLLVGAIDFGHGFYMALEVSSAAQDAALFGVQNPSDAAGMTTLAKMNAQDVSGLNVTSVSGCECSDGTSATTDCTSLFFCSANVVRYVDVTVTGTYVPILSFPGVNTNIALKAHQKMRSTVGP